MGGLTPPPCHLPTAVISDPTLRGGACVALSVVALPNWLGWCPGNVTPLSQSTRQSDVAERSVVAEWRRCLAGLAVQLVDVYRQRYPGSRTNTHFSPVGAARLDRFYISSPFVEWIASARVDGRLPAARAGADSDHRPIALDLIGGG